MKNLLCKPKASLTSNTFCFTFDGSTLRYAFYCQEVSNLRLNLLDCEDLLIVVNINDKTNFVVGTVYRHPLPNDIQFSQAFYNNLFKLKANKKFVVLGNFNIDYGRYSHVTPPTRQLKCLPIELVVWVVNN